MPRTPTKTPPKHRSARNVVQSPYFSHQSPYFSSQSPHSDPQPSSSSSQSYFNPQFPHFSVKSVLQPTANHMSVVTDSLYERLVELKPCLIQEAVADDPWKVLVAVTLLNKTAGKLAIPVFWDIMKTWPTPWALSQASVPELVAKIHSLGTQNVRAKRLTELSRAYLLDPPSRRDLRPSRALGPPLSPTKRGKYPPTPISHLPGTGAYALDSYRIFCSGPASSEWKDVNPTDKELVRYLKWKWAIENVHWEPGIGITASADHRYIAGLISELELDRARKNTAGRQRIPDHALDLQKG
ncbi:DNA glycosylase [Mycena pura]|uniref:DNA glycosylase n=1 Tax=Mycena pura TaxID=153505 RepID=A0AAD6UQS4_9AGAR|nr:DNA glycosylase [Mycena pura]